MELLDDSRDWCQEQFASAEFGNVARARRAALMLRRALERPAGRLTDVFSDAAEQQAAYNFVEGATPPAVLTSAIAEATLRQLADEEFVFVPVDGTSLSLTDRGQTKGFGSIKVRGLPTRGLKVVDALAVRADGTTLGLLDLEWWARAPRRASSRSRRRRLGETETHHWTNSIARVLARFSGHPCVPWFVIDREGDASAILRALASEPCHFTVRVSQRQRPVVSGSTRRAALGRYMRRRPIVGTRVVVVPQAPGRRARVAILDVRSARVSLELPVHETQKRMRIQVGVVWAKERRVPHGEKPVEWMLLTNRPVGSTDQMAAVLDSYRQRWRIEDFHRAWKSGRCCVEDTQLRAKDHVLRWATLLAAVATRIEQLKQLARTKPETLASDVFTDLQIRALIALKRRYKKRTETIPDDVPTVATAVRWLAEVGGYQGKSSGGPPGSVTIGRGLEIHAAWTDAFGYSEELKSKT
ncbi:MAG: IS4-like element ISLpn5 family transposase [Polyangiales bacterium]